MKGGVGMHRALRLVGLIVVLALATGLAIPTSVQAGTTAGPTEADKTKLIELMKASMAMQRGEHELMHELMDKLMKKYPNDPEIKELDNFHEKWHSRAKMQEEIDQRTQLYLDALRGN
jgi:hypothetical protein